MIRAGASDKARVVEILSKSFDTNKSINFVCRQDSRREGRIKLLMEYAFDYCLLFGEVYFSEDRNACLLLKQGGSNRENWRTLIWQLKLALSVIGLSNVKNVLKRERNIKQHHPEPPYSYLWFIGVDPKVQGQGIGSNLLNEYHKSIENNTAILLETSTLQNIPFYEKLGYRIIKEIDLGYTLYIMKK